MAAARRRLGAAAVLRERDQQRAPLRRPERSAYVKDAINDFVVARRRRRGQPGADGYEGRRPPRAGDRAGRERRDPRAPDARRRRRRASTASRWARTSTACWRPAATEADQFYATVIPPTLDADAAMVMRQALAGLLWGKQYYEYDVHRWLREHGVEPVGPRTRRPARSATCPGSTWSRATSSRCPTSGSTRGSRRGTWRSTARRCRWSTSTSPRSRSSCCCSTRYLHPNGQIPAYEWNFSDVNPPVTAWAALYVYEREARDPRRGRPRVPGPRVRAAADELHLVGQSQGPRRPQPVPGRVPRPGQHRHLRSLGAAARRRHARAGRRHGVDGALLPVDAADRGSSWPSTIPPTPTWR